MIETTIESSLEGRVRRVGRRNNQTYQRVPWSRIPRLYAWLLAGAVGAVVTYYNTANPHQKQPLSLSLASFVFVLSCLPMFRFLLKGSVHQVPVLEAHGLFYAMCFGLAGFLPAPRIMASLAVNEADEINALGCTLIGLGTMLFGYYIAGPHLFRANRPIHPGHDIANSSLEKLAWCACAIGLATGLVNRFAPFLGLGQISMMIYGLGGYSLLVLTLERKASPATRIATFLILLPVTLIMRSDLRGGQLTPVVVTICWISLVILRTQRRIPILLLAFAFVFFLIMQPVKFYVRERTWYKDVQPGPWETVQIYAEGFRRIYGSTSSLIENRVNVFESSFERINHLATTAAIIRDTPSRQPYILGRSYIPLLTKWIPRFLWPGKPQEKLGNEWGRRYGFLGTHDTTTSFNLPWLPEMYMNFGIAGVVGIMFVVGLLYRLLWIRLMEHPEKPAEYAVAIVFAQSLVFAESHLSMQLGQLVILAILLFVVAKVIQYKTVDEGKAFPA